jgi:hypothetical protein
MSDRSRSHGGDRDDVSIISISSDTDDGPPAWLQPLLVNVASQAAAVTATRLTEGLVPIVVHLS